MLKLKVLNGFYDCVKILYFTSNQYCFMHEWTSYLFSLFTDINTNKHFTYNKDNIWLFNTELRFRTWLTHLQHFVFHVGGGRLSPPLRKNAVNSKISQFVNNWNFIVVYKTSRNQEIKWKHIKQILAIIASLISFQKVCFVGKSFFDSILITHLLGHTVLFYVLYIFKIDPCWNWDERGRGESAIHSGKKTKILGHLQIFFNILQRIQLIYEFYYMLFFLHTITHFNGKRRRNESF